MMFASCIPFDLVLFYVVAIFHFRRSFPQAISERFRPFAQIHTANRQYNVNIVFYSNLSLSIFFKINHSFRKYEIII